MSKKIFYALTIFFLGQFSYAMEQGEGDYLLSNRDRLLQRSSKQTEHGLSIFEALDADVKELIIEWLPGNDIGLNYLVRLKNFYPSDTTIEKIVRSFLHYLLAKEKEFNFSPELDKVGFYLIHFFEHVEYKEKANLLSTFSDDMRFLDQAITCEEATTCCCITSVADADKLDEAEIKKALKAFFKNTKIKWQNLNELTKIDMPFAKFTKVRNMLLTYFEQRIQNYIRESEFSCTRVPGLICCACTGSNIVVGSMIACFVDEIAGVAVGAAGGGGCFLLCCVGMFMEGPWNHYNYCEFFNDKTKKENAEKKIAELEKLITHFKKKKDKQAKFYKECRTIS